MRRMMTLAGAIVTATLLSGCIIVDDDEFCFAGYAAGEQYASLGSVLADDDDETPKRTYTKKPRPRPVYRDDRYYDDRYYDDRRRRDRRYDDC